MDWIKVLIQLIPYFIAAVVLTIGVIAWKNGYRKQIASMLFYLVCRAEEELSGEGGTGKLKFAAVTTWVYEKLPWYIQLFFPKAEIDRLIELAVTEMKEWLAANAKARALIAGG